MIRMFLYTEGRLNYRALFVLLVSLIAGLAAAGLVTIINEAVGEILEGRIHLNHLPWFIGGLVLLVVSRRYSLRMGADLVERTLERYRNQMGDRIRRMELLRMEHLNSERIYARMTVDTKRISMAAQSFVRIVQSIVVFVYVCFYVLFLSPLAGFMFILLFGVGILYHRWHETSQAATTSEAFQIETRLFETFGQTLDGFKELKIDRDKRLDLLERHLQPTETELKRIRLEIGKNRAHYYAVAYQFLYYLSFGCVVFLLPQDVGLVVRFKIIAVAAFMWEPLCTLTLAVPEVLYAKTSADQLARLEEEMGMAGEGAESVCPPGMEIIQRFDELRAENIVFTYTDRDGKPVFSMGPIHLSIRPGEILFLVGGNGSGKSTLLKLLTGLYPPLSGSFRIDGTEVLMTENRHLFAAVFTDCHLFDGLYGLDPIQDETVHGLLRQMHLENKVEWRDNRLVHSGLSTGQRKRLALIAALLEDKPVYVFDEWAAEQDPEFKAYFYEKLLPSMKAQGKAVIATTHDDRYFDAADRIIRMEYGRIPDGKV